MKMCEMTPYGSIWHLKTIILARDPEQCGESERIMYDHVDDVNLDDDVDDDGDVVDDNDEDEDEGDDVDDEDEDEADDDDD